MVLPGRSADLRLSPRPRFVALTFDLIGALAHRWSIFWAYEKDGALIIPVAFVTGGGGTHGPLKRSVHRFHIGDDDEDDDEDESEGEEDDDESDEDVGFHSADQRSHAQPLAAPAEDSVASLTPLGSTS